MQRFQPENVAGSIIGGAIGDVLGGLEERRSLAISDDTQFTLATCEAIGENGPVSPAAVAARMLAWFEEGRVSGIGSSTLKAMRDLKAGAHWALSGARGEHAAGNGAAMRIAPVAFVLDPANSEERTVIRDIARITHHHEEAYIGALAVVFAIRTAASGELLSAKALAARLPDSRVRDYLLTVASHPEWSITEAAREIGSSGFTPETVAIAVIVAAAMCEAGFENAIYELNEAGGDTDTIASIAGQIAGALIGVRTLPTHVLAQIPEAKQIVSLAERLAARVTAAATGARGLKPKR